MSRGQTTFAKVVLGILGLCEVYALYWLSFSLWMTAYPFANNAMWRTHLYGWLGASVVVGLLWVAVLVWLIRQRRSKA